MVSNLCLLVPACLEKKDLRCFSALSWRFPRGFSSRRLLERPFLVPQLDPAHLSPSPPSSVVATLLHPHPASLNSILHFLFLLFRYALPRLRSSLSLIVLPPTTTTHHPPPPASVHLPRDMGSPPLLFYSLSFFRNHGFSLCRFPPFFLLVVFLLVFSLSLSSSLSRSSRFIGPGFDRTIKSVLRYIHSHFTVINAFSHHAPFLPPLPPSRTTSTTGETFSYLS